MMNNRQLFNAKNAGLKIEAGMKIEVVNVGQFPDTDKEGKAVTVTAMEDSKGAIYTTISATIGDSMDLLTDIIAEEKKVMVQVNESVSNNGRKFFQLQLV